MQGALGASLVPVGQAVGVALVVKERHDFVFQQAIERLCFLLFPCQIGIMFLPIAQREFRSNG